MHKAFMLLSILCLPGCRSAWASVSWPPRNNLHSWLRPEPSRDLPGTDYDIITSETETALPFADPVDADGDTITGIVDVADSVMSNQADIGTYFIWTSSGGPLWKASISNGHPAIRFDGTNDALSTVYGGDAVTEVLGGRDSFEMWLAIKTSDAAGATIFNINDQNGALDPNLAKIEIRIAADGGLRTIVHGSTATTDTASSGTVTINDGALHYIRLRFDASLASLEHKQYVDNMFTPDFEVTNASATIEDSTGHADYGGEFLFFGSPLNPPGDYWAGDLLEAFIFHEKIGADPRVRMCKYLDQRYGTTTTCSAGG